LDLSHVSPPFTYCKPIVWT